MFIAPVGCAVLLSIHGTQPHTVWHGRPFLSPVRDLTVVPVIIYWRCFQPRASPMVLSDPVLLLAPELVQASDNSNGSKSEGNGGCDGGRLVTGSQSGALL